MAAAKRVKSAEPDKSSPEDERALNRLLALLSGRGEFDRPSTPLRERANPFGRPANRVAEDWRGADHAVIPDH
jgi:hypothetical protein